MYGARIHAFILAFVTATTGWAMDTPNPEPKDPAMEQAHAAIDKLCTFGCAEYTKLKKEVAVYEQQHAKK